MTDFFEAHYSDGRTAARTKVSVKFGSDALIIEPDSGEEEQRTLVWMLHDLRLADEMRKGQAVRLINIAQADARLSFTDDSILDPLLAIIPELRGSRVLGRRPGLRIVQWMGGIAAAVAILFVGLPRVAEPVAALMPLAWEEALGEQVFAGFQGSGKFCEASGGEAALKRLTDRLMANLDSRYSFRFAVVDSPAINAFAAPGGYIVIYRGLIADAQSSDDVAGVLAHEIGHVIERHATEGIVRASGLALIVQLLLGDPTGILGVGAAAGEMLISLAYTRDDEAEADTIAVDILAASDIDSDGFVRFLQRMAMRADEGDSPEGNSSTPFLSTHPRSAERAAIVQATGSPGGPAMSNSDWRQLQEICG